MNNTEEPSPAKIEKVKKFIPHFEKLCLEYVRPILFGELPLISREPVLKGATITFVNTGSNSFGITDYHVFEKYLELKNKLKNFRCQIDNLTFDLESRLIDYNSDSNIDLATFKINDDEFRLMSAKPLHHKSWPVKLKNETKTEPVFILGFPGHLRSITSTTNIMAAYVSLLLTIETINDNQIGIVLRRENWTTIFKTSKPVDLSKFRGISGAGVFRMNNIVPELLGIVTDHSENLDILLCTRSDILTNEGNINLQHK